jgi:16S rRNA (adenine1518-N6/adenine1519-N6)-dimethyltransferase
MPKKSLGQNFLVDARVVDRIVGEFAPAAGETVVEIGPGRGALTGRLLGLAGRVVAVEFDRDLIPVLSERFGGRENFRLVHGDALAADFCELIRPARAARVVANLPYNISTAILQKLIGQRGCLTEFVLMLQREVVERMTAPAGSSGRGYLSVLVEAACEAEPLFDVSPAAFRPVPKVWSAVVRLRPRPLAAGDVRAEPLFWQLVGAGFAQKRKTILNNLRAAPGPVREAVESSGGAQPLLEAAALEPSRRAESLTLADWVRLAESLRGPVRG